MKRFFLSSQPGAAPVFLRVLLGGVIFPHGAQKLLGWFGGYGFEGTMQYFTGTAGLPWIIGLLVILIEFFAALFLVAGFATRISAAAIGIVMTGVILTQMHDYFFMNWFGNQKTEGMEFFLLTIGMSVALVITGAGSLSVDRWLVKAPPGAGRAQHSGRSLVASRA